MKTLKKINEELKGLKQYEVVIFGSFIQKKSTVRSDIDIAVITKIKNNKKNKDIWYKLLAKVPDKYDLKIFELLPLPIKMEIIKNYAVLFGNHLDISEYFYHFRNLWKDVEKRYRENQFASIKEKRELLQRAKGLILNVK